MDALTLLRDVSAAYRGVRSLAIEAAIVNESGDENASQRSEQRVRFLYAAPDRIRYEPLAKEGFFQVTDGEHLHTVFNHRGPGGGPRHNTIPVAQMHRLPHLFRADFPLAGGDEAFLFQGIEDGVTAAEILREEDGCYVVAVSYQSPPHPGLIIGGAGIQYWIGAGNHMVMRQHGEVGHRFPTEDEVSWTRHTISVREVRIDQPLPEDTFYFTPPVESTPLVKGRCGISMGGGGGFIEGGPDEGRRLEHHGSHEWQGDVLVEHSKWKMRGMTFTFERRLKFSADEKELQIEERIGGPVGEAKTSCSLAVG